MNEKPFDDLPQTRLEFISNKRDAGLKQRVITKCEAGQRQQADRYPLLDTTEGRCFATDVLTIIAYHDVPDLANLRYMVRAALAETSPVSGLASSVPVQDHAETLLDEHHPAAPPSVQLKPLVPFRYRTPSGAQRISRDDA